MPAELAEKAQSYESLHPKDAQRIKAIRTKNTWQEWMFGHHFNWVPEEAADFIRQEYKIDLKKKIIYPEVGDKVKEIRGVEEPSVDPHFSLTYTEYNHHDENQWSVDPDSYNLQKISDRELNGEPSPPIIKNATALTKSVLSRIMKK